MPPTGAGAIYAWLAGRLARFRALSLPDGGCARALLEHVLELARLGYPAQYIRGAVHRLPRTAAAAVVVQGVVREAFRREHAEFYKKQRRGGHGHVASRGGPGADRSRRHRRGESLDSSSSSAERAGGRRRSVSPGYKQYLKQRRDAKESERLQQQANILAAALEKKFAGLDSLASGAGAGPSWEMQSAPPGGPCFSGGPGYGPVFGSATAPHPGGMPPPTFRPEVAQRYVGMPPPGFTATWDGMQWKQELPQQHAFPTPPFASFPPQMPQPPLVGAPAAPASADAGAGTQEALLREMLGILKAGGASTPRSERSAASSAQGMPGTPRGPEDRLTTSQARLLELMVKLPDDVDASQPLDKLIGAVAAALKRQDVARVASAWMKKHSQEEPPRPLRQRAEFLLRLLSRC